MNLYLLFFLLSTKFYFASCESNCVNIKTCGECIGFASDECIWCAADAHDGDRCQSGSSNLNNITWCNGKIYSSKVTYEIKQDKNFTKGENGEDVVQFKPQLIKVKARPGVPVDIIMSYKPAKDYPLDIYYLIDYSRTMLEQVETLKEQGKSIYEGLLHLTNNVRLGFGSFVEKPSLPFVDVNMQTSYSFKNHLSLTENKTEFAKALNDKPSGVNYDAPEAGFDALMQVMACRKELNWRENARRIIVLSTDSTYHSAGDGKYVGAFIQHDMKCHLVNNMYTEDLKFDYPSVSQINKIATENNFMIIFAAVPNVTDHYKALEKNIQGSKYVPLEASPKLLEMIKEEYLSLIRNMQLEYTMPDFMQLTFDPDCNKPGNCVLQHDQHIDIKGTLMINSCPPDNMFTYLVKVGPRLLGEKLSISVEVDCQCDCEKPGKGEQNSNKCSLGGTYQCGVCKCNDDRHGDVCQCEGSKSDIKDSDKCKENEGAVYLCSGHGKCSCGICTCYKDFSGQFCEYDDKACLTSDGNICYGNGICKFGKCQCDAQWLPDYCMCPVDKEKGCIAPQSHEVCSGNGECVCGKCVCNSRNSTHGKCSGMFCDDCEEVAKRCKELEDYAYCNLNNKKIECDEKYNLSDAIVTIVNKTEINSPEYFEANMWCKKIVEDGKAFIFKYHYPNLSTLRLIIQSDLETPPVANILIAAGSVIGAVLLIGIITVIVWKILVDLHDKREYTKFLEQSEAAGFDTTLNPFYEPPSINFTNPVYSG
ncbi:unnamed protein product, partial [Brenthis ino]